MVEFEIMGITKNSQEIGFSVEIETEDRKRERFGFPFGDGWETKEENGNEKFINEIAKALNRRQDIKKNQNSMDFKSFKGKKIKLETNKIVSKTPKITIRAV